MAGQTLTSDKDFETCQALEVIVEVFDLEGNERDSGIITNFTPLHDVIYVDNKPFDRNEYLFYADVPIGPR